MNTTQNKASLWKSCVEQGVFDKVPSELQHQVQGLFEKTVNQFNNEGLELGMANQFVLKEFKLQLGKMIGQPMNQKSFEELNQEYKGMYAPTPPEKIEFSKEKDTPIEDLESILKLKSEQRQNEIHEFFKEDQKIGGVVEPIAEPISSSIIQPMNQSMNQPMIQSMIQPMNPILPSNSDHEELVFHRRILESILEAQLKIIEMLERK
jgi:hypothetical protein